MRLDGSITRAINGGMVANWRGGAQELIDNMPHRVHELLAAGGWYTEF